MSSLIVFDRDSRATVLEFDPEETTNLSDAGAASVLVFDPPELQDSLEAPDVDARLLQADPVQTDVWIGDPIPTTEVVEGNQAPDFVVVDDDGTELLVVEPRGPRGAPGQDGQDGDTKYDDMVDLTLLFENHLI